jgi:hypothetical protein
MATDTDRVLPGSKEKEATFDGAKFLDSMSAEQAAALEIPEAEAVEGLPGEAHDALTKKHEEATRDKLEAVKSARARVGEISDLGDKLRTALEEEIRGKATEQAIKKTSAAGVDDIRLARELSDEELDAKGITTLIQTAPLEQVYGRLKDLSPGRLRRVIAELAEDMPEYQFESEYIIAADVLASDLEHRFADISAKMDEVRSTEKEVITGFLAKRKETTEQFIAARDGIDKARREGKPAAIDITAMQDNIEGTYEASKEMDHLVKKGPLVSQRKFWDPDTKTHIIELVFRAMEGEGKQRKINNKEVIVEYWNSSKRGGGELIRSTYLRSGSDEVKTRRPQLKFWKGFKTKEDFPLDARWNVFSRYDAKLSRSARSQIDSIDAGSVEASTRSEEKVDGLTKRRATNAKLYGRMAGTMGMSEKDARRASRVGKNRGVSFMQDLISRMFNNSRKISKKS